MITDVTRWETEELALSLELVSRFISKGFNDLKISAEMSVSVDEVRQLKNILVERIADVDLHDNPAKLYLHYKLRQERFIEELEDLREELKGTNQANAILGSIRAKSDIVDKVLKAGQDLGVLPRAAQRKEFLAILATMTPDQMEKLIEEKAGKFESMRSRHRGRSEYKYAEIEA